MGKSKENGYWATLSAGFYAVKVQDNDNVYGVIVSECISNLFKDGMWQKMLTPFMLIVSGGDRTLVGNAITLNGITRAVSGIFAGRCLLDRFGTDGTFILTGLCGMIGMCINFYLLLTARTEDSAWSSSQSPASNWNTSALLEQDASSSDGDASEALVEIRAVFLLNFVWAFYNGLWNTCLETEWTRSVLQELREDTNGTRQILNKLTTAMGPLFGIAMLLAYGSNHWSVPVVSTVMLVGTALTGLPVLLCFRFNRNYQIHQEADLCEIDTLEFREGKVECGTLVRKDFVGQEDGLVKLTYPLKDTSKFAKLRVLTPDLKETGFILGKQEMSWFQGVPQSEDKICFIHFSDPSRPGARAVFQSATIFLGKGGVVNPNVSTISFRLYPDLKRLDALYTNQSMFSRVSRKIMSRRPSKEMNPQTQEEVSKSLTIDDDDGDSSNRKASKANKPNIRMANLIVSCDVLNAIGSGISLKFMDIFLIQEHGVSPIGILFLSFVQNLAAVYFTPVAKQTITWLRNRNIKGAIGVSIIWGLSLSFLGVLCIEGMPLPIILVSIVLMQSLSSCTKAYNRGKLQSSLPQNRVANYMVWDSLNKANQGGIAIFGAQLVNGFGYRGCFMVTFLILLLRWLAWTGDIVLNRGMKRHKKPDLKVDTSETGQMTKTWTRFVDDEKWTKDDALVDEVDSELFDRASISCPELAEDFKELAFACPETPYSETPLSEPLLSTSSRLLRTSSAPATAQHQLTDQSPH